MNYHLRERFCAFWIQPLRKPIVLDKIKGNPEFPPHSIMISSIKPKTTWHNDSQKQVTCSEKKIVHGDRPWDDHSLELADKNIKAVIITIFNDYKSKHANNAGKEKNLSRDVETIIKSNMNYKTEM